MHTRFDAARRRLYPGSFYAVARCGPHQVPHPRPRLSPFAAVPPAQPELSARLKKRYYYRTHVARPVTESGSSFALRYGGRIYTTLPRKRHTGIGSGGMAEASTRTDRYLFIARHSGEQKA